VRFQRRSGCLLTLSKKNIFTIGEIANMVYGFILQAEESDAELDATLLALDAAGALVQSSIDAEPFQKVDAIQQDGMAKVFSMSIARVKDHFVDFLSYNASRMTFSFAYPKSLENFSEMLNAFLKGKPSIPITVAINMFFDEKKFGKMLPWEATGMVHGYKQNAEKHVKRWMNAVETLPNDTKLIVILCKPWLDYRLLQAHTAVLRDPDNFDTVEVAVQMDLWDRLEGKEFHLAMTLSSILGCETKLAAEIDEQQVEELINHGCRGFRGTV
jgi:phosphotransacetylase